jgi:cytochrome b
MNDTNQTPPPLPPQIPLGQRVPDEDPTERAPLNGIAAAIEAILRQPRRVQHALRQPGAMRVIGAMMLVAVVCALIYGVVVGTFSRGPQLWIAPLKIAGGMLVASVICLPSLYIFACLSGSRARLSEMAGLLAGLLLLTTLLLIGFAPVAWLFSESTSSVGWMGFLHLIFWGIATIFGMRFLSAGFAGTEARSQAGLNVWALIFILVCLQLTTALRPIIGTADTVFPGATEKKFFIKHWMDELGKPTDARESSQRSYND